MSTYELDQSMLEARIQFLQAENQSLKQQLTQLAMENSTYQHVVLTKEQQRTEHRNRWEYYHANKGRIRQELLAKAKDPVSTVIVWTAVKRQSDLEYAASKI